MGDSDSLSFNQIQDNSDDLGALEETDECVCCCEVLEDSLLLTCLHSICRSCVDSQTTDHIKCPRCRSTSSCHNLVKDYLHSVDPPQPRHWDSQDTVVEMTGIISRGRERIEACNENINKLTNNLGELHEEREKMKQQIEDSYKIFSSVLERRREESMLQLENIFNDRELSTMDQLEDLNLSQAHLEHTIQYVSRVISEFPDTEARSILPMAKVQLESNMRVLDTLSRQDKPAKTLVCKSDLKLFQKAVMDSFGSFGNYDDSSVSAENLVIPEIAQRNVMNSRSTHTKAITNMDRSRMLPTSTDLLSPQGGDQGFVSPGDHLLSPLGDHQGLLSLGKPGLSLQVPSYSGQHGSLSVPVGSPRGPSPRSHGPIGSNLSSPSHHGYSSGRMGNSHPDLSYAAHTPPLYGRGHTPPLQGSGHTPPLITQDTAHRNDFSLAELADKINRSNSGPSHHNFTLAELISNVAENPNKDWDAAPAPSQAYSNLAALAKLDEMQDKSGNWSSVDHNLLLPDLERSSLSRSMSALTSGQLSPLPLRAQGSPIPYGLNIPGLDHRGVSPISPIDGMMPSMPGAPGSPFPPIRGNRSVNLMQVRCKFGTLGPGKGQFNSPVGFCLGVDEEIIVADTNNHRIQIFEKNGTYRSQFGVTGKEEGQLYYPRKVAVMKSSGKFVICDRGNERSRMQIFTKQGHFVRKISIRFVDIVASLAITREGHIVVVDSVTPTLFIISEQGEIISWFECADYMREPSDIFISGTDFYICDFKGHNVVVFSEAGEFKRRIGFENITNFPNGIDVSDAGDILIGDSHGNRFHVAVFSSEGKLLGEFECPHVKVSRCCGLKITSEGYVVTLAKNNHHVLVLNTLYIP